MHGRCMGGNESVRGVMAGATTHVGPGLALSCL